jgi:tRNA(Arg) A34 adenosine deaminase TadA
MCKYKDQINSVCDELIIKRTAQNKGSKIKNIVNNEHMCAILKEGVPISYGTNLYRPNKIMIEHAESNAFKNLIKRRKNQNILSSKRIKVDVLIIRTNRSNSKPCVRCLNEMDSLKNMFNIRNVHYTSKDELGGIRSVKFADLIKEEHHICSYDIHYNIKN